MKRCLLIVSMLLLPACIPLPSPDAPEGSGFFGYVRLQRVESQEGQQGRNVVAAAGDAADGDAVDPSAPVSTADHNGNFTIEAASGSFRLCLAEGTTLVQCDCVLELAPGERLLRDYTTTESALPVARWAGQWTDGSGRAVCTTPQ